MKNLKSITQLFALLAVILLSGCASGPMTKVRSSLADVREAGGNAWAALRGQESVEAYGVGGTDTIVLVRQNESWYCNANTVQLDPAKGEGQTVHVASALFKLDGACKRGDQVTITKIMIGAINNGEYHGREANGTTWQCSVDEKTMRLLAVGSTRTMAPGTLASECSQVEAVTGPVTGKVIATLHSPPIGGKQYVRSFTIATANGQEATCPVNVESEKIAVPKGATYFGTMTRSGCYSLN